MLYRAVVMREAYTSTCFVIMPFRVKQLEGGREVDFDAVYERVFAPAISEVALPEGGKLVPKRTDQDFFAGDISVEMFRYLEYSRLALADITGLNANVLYEIGVRHHAHVSGTVVVRQSDARIPFDLNNVKAFPYEYEPEQRAVEARALITRVLRESLEQGRLDSPVQLTLRAQQNDPPAVQAHLLAAENAIRANELERAIEKLARAASIVPGNAIVRLKLGLLLKGQGAWEEALLHFEAATQNTPLYADAWRERGIAENKLFKRRQGQAGGAPTGEDALRHAVRLNPNDFDALACLGGIFKRAQRYGDALEQYQRSREISGGNSYPLLNEIKLRARLAGKLELDQDAKLALVRVEPGLRAQALDPSGAFNAPWSLFDLSEVRLYRGDAADFLAVLRVGLKACTARYQPETHAESLGLLLGVAGAPPELEEAIFELERRKRELP
jgi:tetratricopeptide (TPR) repeat protein